MYSSLVGVYQVTTLCLGAVVHLGLDPHPTPLPHPNPAPKGDLQVVFSLQSSELLSAI